MSNRQVTTKTRVLLVIDSTPIQNFVSDFKKSGTKTALKRKIRVMDSQGASKPNHLARVHTLAGSVLWCSSWQPPSSDWLMLYVLSSDWLLFYRMSSDWLLFYVLSLMALKKVLHQLKATFVSKTVRT